MTFMTTIKEAFRQEKMEKSIKLYKGLIYFRKKSMPNYDEE